MAPASLRPAVSPRELGYILPAEWEPHEATWLAWPHDPITFPDRIESVEESYVKIISALLPGERVDLLVKDPAMRERALSQLKRSDVDLANLRTHVVDYADVWVRDYAPLFVQNRSTGKLAGIKWTFNAWGGKYEGHKADNGVAHQLRPSLGVDLLETGYVLEGGSIDVNGRGTLLTTEQCLLNPNRNGSVEKARVERLLFDFLGASHVVWLPEGLEGDDTDGHIDDLARFVDPTTVVCAFDEEESGTNRRVLEENFERLRRAADQDGRSLRVVPIPMPGIVGDAEGRLPASYANFYIANRVVLVPVFDHPHDAEALQVLQRLFPDRQVLGVPCKDMVYGLGTIHCASMQQPSALASSSRRG